MAHAHRRHGARIEYSNQDDMNANLGLVYGWQPLTYSEREVFTLELATRATEVTDQSDALGFLLGIH